MYNQQSKTIKRELIQFGAPIFGQIKDDATTKSQNSKLLIFNFFKWYSQHQHAWQLIINIACLILYI